MISNSETIFANGDWNAESNKNGATFSLKEYFGGLEAAPVRGTCHLQVY